MQTRRWFNPEIAVAILLATMIPWMIFTTSSIYSLREDFAVVKSQLKILVKGFAAEEPVIDDKS